MKNLVEDILSVLILGALLGVCLLVLCLLGTELWAGPRPRHTCEPPAPRVEEHRNICGELVRPVYTQVKREGGVR